MKRALGASNGRGEPAYTHTREWLCRDKDTLFDLAHPIFCPVARQVKDMEAEIRMLRDMVKARESDARAMEVKNEQLRRKLGQAK